MWTCIKIQKGAQEGEKIMKKTFGFYTILSTMMILLITTSAGAFYTGTGKGVYEGDRQSGRQLGIRANDSFVKERFPA